jgi:solute:Na+ symporter, SSS family
MATIDYAILGIYVLFVLGIGFALKRSMKSSADFFMSGRAIPAWITGLAFISANLGALELVGMGASGAKYGMATCHFYWIGAIPGMVFLAVFMMPFYYGSKARSVPEYLKLRFDERTRCFNSISFAVMTIMASGISMHMLAKLLNELLPWADLLRPELLPWKYDISLWVCSAIVLVYVLKGGLTSAIYTEVLQFCMIVLGFAPVVYLGMQDIGGWSNLHTALTHVAQNPKSVNVAVNAHPFVDNAWTSAWQPLLAGSSANPMGIDWFGMAFGLGFVLAFGYWCTNFLVVQRAMAARNMTAARRTPLIGAIPKMFLPALVILPGMLAIGLTSASPNKYHLPQKELKKANIDAAIAAVEAAAKNPEQQAALSEFATGKVDKPSEQAKDALKKISKAADTDFNQFALAKVVDYRAKNPVSKDALKEILPKVTENDYNAVIVSLIKKYCPPGLLGLALTALLASFMSGMAGNVTAFNTVWTYDLYQAYLAPNRSDAHYMWMGRVVTVVGIVLSIGAAYVAANWNNAMDIIQLVFGFVNAPLFATFILGMFSARTTSSGAFYGLVGGTGTSAAFHALTLSTGNAPGVKGGYLGVLHEFPSEMAQNFYLAAFAFTVCFVLTVVISLLGRREKSDEELKGLVYSLTPRTVDHEEAWYVKPGFLGIVLLIVCLVMNYIFW